MWLELFWAFVIGGAICSLAQLLMDSTPFFISSAHILVTVLLIGEILGFFGLYQPLIDFAGMGAAVPLCGFGNTLISGVIDDIHTKGFMGILTGGFTAGAAGLATALFFGFITALIAKPRS